MQDLTFQKSHTGNYLSDQTRPDGGPIAGIFPVKNIYRIYVNRNDTEVLHGRARTFKDAKARANELYREGR